MAWETEHRELVPDTIRDGIQSFLARPDYGFYLVAEIESRVAGCLMVTFEWSDWRNGLFWWIQSVYVDPDFRRRGVFKTLYQTVERRARESDGVCGLRLYVEQENVTAQETYRAMGMGKTPYRIFETTIP
ncbi:MAG: GNAT family N-acetyltransferase [Fibrella sp.]|nr:GNAT family N-acetyltransferase [Armatimonadota bacterium]